MTQAYGIREDDSVYTVEILGECRSDDDAVDLAQHYADLWQRAVKLYRVPFINTGSAAWAEDEAQFVCRIEPTATNS